MEMCVSRTPLRPIVWREVAPDCALLHWVGSLLVWKHGSFGQARAAWRAGQQGWPVGLPRLGGEAGLPQLGGRPSAKTFASPPKKAQMVGTALTVGLTEHLGRDSSRDGTAVSWLHIGIWRGSEKAARACCATARSCIFRLPAHFERSRKWVYSASVGGIRPSAWPRQRCSVSTSRCAAARTTYGPRICSGDGFVLVTRAGSGSTSHALDSQH